jgi:cysteine desulfurase
VAEQGVLFHTDAVQAAGKIPLHLKDFPIHLASFSGHKLHGPKGIGALYVNPKVAFRPLFRGGGQEHQRRAGTENVAGIVGLGKAAELAHQALCETPDYVLTLRNDFEQLLRENLPDVIFHGARAKRLPNTSHFSIPGTHAEGMLILMDMQGIQLSAGSACHTGALEASHVLTAMGISPPEARESLRVSFAREHRAEDVAFLLQALTKGARKMRGILQS